MYGEARAELKHCTWSQMRDLCVQPTVPWLCAGDFNEILFAHEKEGGREKSQLCMDRFRETSTYCQLHDLGFERDVFTWRNHNHVAENYNRERLDRACANDEWRARFPATRVINGDPRHSDHRPVIIETNRAVFGGMRTSERGFAFEASWLGEETCSEVVGDSWRAAMEEQGTTTLDALKSVASGLMNWSTNVQEDLEK